MVTSPHKTAVCLVFEASRRILLTLKDSPDCAWPTKDNLSLVNLQSTGLGTGFLFFLFFIFFAVLVIIAARVLSPVAVSGATL